MIDAPAGMCSQRRPRDPEHRVEVGLQRPIELLVRDVGDVLLVGLLAGIVHKDVEPAEPASRLLDQVDAEGAIGDVARQQHRLAAFRLDKRRHRLGVRHLLLQKAQRDVGALAREGDRRRAPDAGVGARDEGLAPGQPAVADIRRFPVIGFRIHRGRDARRGLRLLGERGLRILLARVLHAQAVVGSAGHS